MPSAGDIRAELARHNIRLYKVAARVGLHPTLLSRIIHERAPLSPMVATRIMSAIRDEQQRSTNGGAR